VGAANKQIKQVYPKVPRGKSKVSQEARNSRLMTARSKELRNQTERNNNY